MNINELQTLLTEPDRFVAGERIEARFLSDAANGLWFGYMLKYVGFILRS
jgi:hypothetical protein